MIEPKNQPLRAAIFVSNLRFYRGKQYQIYLGKTLDNNDLNQVMASSSFSENKGLGWVLSLAGS